LPAIPKPQLHPGVARAEYEKSSRSLPLRAGERRPISSGAIPLRFVVPCPPAISVHSSSSQIPDAYSARYRKMWAFAVGSQADNGSRRDQTLRAANYCADCARRLVNETLVSLGLLRRSGSKPAEVTHGVHFRALTGVADADDRPVSRSRGTNRPCGRRLAVDTRSPMRFVLVCTEIPQATGGAVRATEGMDDDGELRAQGVRARQANATPARGLRLWIHRGRFRATHVASRSTQLFRIRSRMGRDYQDNERCRSSPAIFSSHESENEPHPNESVKASHGQPKADISHQCVGLEVGRSGLHSHFLAQLFSP